MEMAGREKNKEKLESYLERYEYYTRKTSDISRNLAFAGIAIVWIFRTTTHESTSIPTPLIAPLILLVITLGLDLLQYVSGGLIWIGYWKFKQNQLSRKKITLESEITPPRLLPAIIHLFYWTKLVSIGIAYYWLITFLYSEFIEP
ncbi:MAG: hypothetical protein IIA45_12985 [Bacteroidetes bacterium]|nr:hypothetical protein [Bacteroidota bacterium]